MGTNLLNETSGTITLVSSFFRVFLLLQLFIAGGVCAETPTDFKAESEKIRSASKRILLMELFTSSACLRCPPASDSVAALSDFFSRNGDEAVVLTFPVDYLNTPTLKDENSTPAFTERLRFYAKNFRQRRIAVPQVVINGSRSVSGLEPDKIKQVAEREMAESKIRMRISGKWVAQSDILRIKYDVSGFPKGKHNQLYLLNVAVVNKKFESTVSEDDRPVLFRHRNLVRLFESIRLDSDEQSELELHWPVTVDREEVQIIGFVQDAKKLTVLGLVKNVAQE